MSAAPDALATRRARNDRRVLGIALFALAAVFVLWYRDDRHAWTAWILFAAPPLLLGLRTVLGGGRLSRFLAGVLGLFWFSHGVMLAWADAAHRRFALAEVALAVTIIFAANAAGLRAKLLRSA